MTTPRQDNEAEGTAKTGKLMGESAGVADTATDEKPTAAQAARDWPELDKVVEEVKMKRAAEIAAQETQRNAALKATQDAEQAWTKLDVQRSLDELGTRLTTLGVVVKPLESVTGSHSLAVELSRLPKGDVAVIRVDTQASRNGPRTTVQVQRGSQQLPAVVVASNSNGELRRSLVDVAQKLLT